MNARSCRSVAGDSLAARSEVNGLAVQLVKLREAEGAMERYWLVIVGARRANREKSDMFAGGSSRPERRKLSGAAG